MTILSPMEKRNHSPLMENRCSHMVNTLLHFALRTLIRLEVNKIVTIIE